MAGARQSTEFIYLGKKIMEINTAIFKPDSETSIIPNNIITTQSFTEDGSIWFYTSCQKNVNIALTKEFYATLEYFNKEKHTRICVNGVATLLTEEEAPEELKSGFGMPSIAARQILLVQFNVQKAEFYNAGMDANDPWFTKLRLSLQSLLLTSNEKKKFTIDIKS